MRKKLIALTLTLCVCAIPLWAIVSGRSLMGGRLRVGDWIEGDVHLIQEE